MNRASNLLSVGHSHILSVNPPKGEFEEHLLHFSIEMNDLWST